MNLTDKDRFAFALIVDFPIYERDDETGKIDFEHNPFSMPQGGLIPNGDPLQVMGYQYDLPATGMSLSLGQSGTTNQRSCSKPSKLRDMVRMKCANALAGW